MIEAYGEDAPVFDAAPEPTFSLDGACIADHGAFPLETQITSKHPFPETEELLDPSSVNAFYEFLADHAEDRPLELYRAQRHSNPQASRRLKETHARRLQALARGHSETAEHYRSQADAKKAAASSARRARRLEVTADGTVRRVAPEVHPEAKKHNVEMVEAKALARVGADASSPVTNTHEELDADLAREYPKVWRELHESLDMTRPLNAEKLLLLEAGELPFKYRRYLAVKQQEIHTVLAPDHTPEERRRLFVTPGVPLPFNICGGINAFNRLSAHGCPVGWTPAFWEDGKPIKDGECQQSPANDGEITPQGYDVASRCRCLKECTSAGWHTEWCWVDAASSSCPDKQISGSRAWSAIACTPPSQRAEGGGKRSNYQGGRQLSSFSRKKKKGDSKIMKVIGMITGQHVGRPLGARKKWDRGIAVRADDSIEACAKACKEAGEEVCKVFDYAQGSCLFNSRCDYQQKGNGYFACTRSNVIGKVLEKAGIKGHKNIPTKYVDMAANACDGAGFFCSDVINTKWYIGERENPFAKIQVSAPLMCNARLDMESPPLKWGPFEVSAVGGLEYDFSPFGHGFEAGGYIGAQAALSLAIIELSLTLTIRGWAMTLPQCGLEIGVGLELELDVFGLVGAMVGARGIYTPDISVGDCAIKENVKAMYEEYAQVVVAAGKPKPTMPQKVTGLGAHWEYVGAGRCSGGAAWWGFDSNCGAQCSGYPFHASWGSSWCECYRQCPSRSPDGGHVVSAYRNVPAKMCTIRYLEQEAYEDSKMNLATMCEIATDARSTQGVLATNHDDFTCPWGAKTDARVPGCCVMGDSASCGKECAKKKCLATGGEFPELDFQKYLYTCCPKDIQMGGKCTKAKPCKEGQGNCSQDEDCGPVEKGMVCKQQGEPWLVEGDGLCAFPGTFGGMNSNCAAKCADSAFYSIWNTGWCACFDSCPNLGPDAPHVVKTYRRQANKRCVQAPPGTPHRDAFTAGFERIKWTTAKMCLAEPTRVVGKLNNRDCGQRCKDTPGCKYYARKLPWHGSMWDWMECRLGFGRISATKECPDSDVYKKIPTTSTRFDDGALVTTPDLAVQGQPLCSPADTHEAHTGESGHGDVCRIKGGRGAWYCPIGCQQTPGAPFCVVPGTAMPCHKGEKDATDDKMQKYVTGGYQEAGLPPAGTPCVGGCVRTAGAWGDSYCWTTADQSGNNWGAPCIPLEAQVDNPTSKEPAVSSSSPVPVHNGNGPWPIANAILDSDEETLGGQCTWPNRGSVAIKAAGHMWWQVDLQRPTAVGSVRYRSTNLPGLYSKDTKISVCKDSGGVRCTQCGGLVSHTIPNSWVQVKCPAGTEGQYVRLDRSDPTHNWHFCRVQVYSAGDAETQDAPYSRCEEHFKQLVQYKAYLHCVAARPPSSHAPPRRRPAPCTAPHRRLLTRAGGILLEDGDPLVRRRSRRHVRAV